MVIFLDVKKRLDPAVGFAYFATLGPERRLATVARHFGVSDGAVRVAAMRYKWKERVLQVTRDARAELFMTAPKLVATLNKRHLFTGQRLRIKADAYLRKNEFSNTGEALKALEVAIRLERMALGEKDAPVKNTNLNISGQFLINEGDAERMPTARAISCKVSETKNGHAAEN